MKTLEEKEKDAKLKAKAAELHLKDEEKPFQPSPQLVEATANATRAEEKYEELAQNEQKSTTPSQRTQRNPTLYPERTMSRLKDLLLENKTESLKKQFCGCI